MEGRWPSLALTVVVVDSETRTEVTSIAIPEDIDDRFYDVKK
jgi:hypothetical protein